jgi:hypothetical protein
LQTVNGRQRFLATSPAAIDTELLRLKPLIEAGGYIPTCDHNVPPNVSLDNYRHLLGRLREDYL